MLLLRNDDVDPRVLQEQVEAALEFAKGSGVLDYDVTVVPTDKIVSRPITRVTVNDPDSNAPVELEIRKLETGGMVGIDGSFLANTDEPVYSPFDLGSEIDIPDDETQEFTINLKVPRDINEAAKVLSQAALRQDRPANEFVGLVVEDVLGHGWVDEELQNSLLESIVGLFDGVTLEDAE